MRFFSTILLALLPLVAVAAKVDKWQEYHSKSLSSIPLKLDDRAYDQFTATPRDYSIVVLLTALEPRYGCQMCREFQPEWELLAKSWTKGDKAGESRLVYATLDFADGKNTFQSLNLQTAPVLIFYPPTAGPHAVPNAEPIRYDFSTGNPISEVIHAWLSRQLPDRPHPPFRRPVNWVRIMALGTTVLGAITTLSIAWPYLLPIIQSRNIWAAISLIAILLFTSGHMFNHIRKVPYVVGDGRGGVSYFAGGFSNQFGLETQIIAAIYGVLAFAIISLALKVPRIADSKTQQLAVLIWGGVVFMTYSFLLSVFRMKNGGYPFWLPPFS